MVLVGNSFFRVGAAKSLFITSLLFGVSMVLITLFSDVSQLSIEVVDKLFDSSFVLWLHFFFFCKAISFFIGPFTDLHSWI